MKKFTLFLIFLFLFTFTGTCFAEIKRDIAGNITGNTSINTIPYNDNFDVIISFRGEHNKTKANEDAITAPRFSILLDFVCKINNTEELKKTIGDIHFIDRSFAYKTREMPQAQMSVRNPLSMDSDGYVTVNKTGNVYDKSSANTIDTNPKDSARYEGPKISIFFDGRYVSDPGSINPLNKVTPFSDQIFAGYLMRSMFYRHGLRLAFSYSADRSKNFNDYSPEERKNLNRLEIEIPDEILAEWQEVVNFQTPEPQQTP